MAFLACVHLALFLALSLSPGNSLVSSWSDRSMLASLLLWCLTDFPLYNVKNPLICFLYCARVAGYVCGVVWCRSVCVCVCVCRCWRWTWLGVVWSRAAVYSRAPVNCVTSTTSATRSRLTRAETPTTSSPPMTLASPPSRSWLPARQLRAAARPRRSTWLLRTAAAVRRRPCARPCPLLAFAPSTTAPEPRSGSRLNTPVCAHLHAHPHTVILIDRIIELNTAKHPCTLYVSAVVKLLSKRWCARL